MLVLRRRPRAKRKKSNEYGRQSWWLGRATERERERWGQRGQTRVKMAVGHPTKM